MTGVRLAPSGQCALAAARAYLGLQISRELPLLYAILEALYANLEVIERRCNGPYPPGKFCGVVYCILA